MKLCELEPVLYKYGGPNASGHTLTPVASVDEADAIMFLCPKCFTANGGAVGTHSVLVSFAGRNMPEDADRNPCWTLSGQSVDNLTLTPSILFHDGCKWHGFVTTGAIVTC